MSRLTGNASGTSFPSPSRRNNNITTRKMREDDISHKFSDEEDDIKQDSKMQSYHTSSQMTGTDKSIQKESWKRNTSKMSRISDPHEGAEDQEARGDGAAGRRQSKLPARNEKRGKR